MLKFLLKYYLSLISMFFISRVLLITIYSDKMQDFSFSEYFKIFIFGIRMDTIISSIVLVIPLIIFTIAKTNSEKFFSYFLKYYTLVVISSLIFIEIATFAFIDQYNVRPNYIFIEYIAFPKQIFDMIVENCLFELILAITTITIFTIVFLKKFNKDILSEVIYTDIKYRMAVFIPILLVLFLGARSSLGLRPANISDALWSDNRTANEITKNSLHSVLTDIYRNIKYKDSQKLALEYGKIDMNDAFKNVQTLLGVSDKSTSLKRLNASHFKNTNTKNIVFILEESLGARFVEAVGGEKGLTPNLNNLAKEGLLFTNAYSNGTRSNRALVGISTGFLAIPGEQLLKRNKAQQDFFSIAKLLKPYNYKTSFMYGGESRFDNMGNFFMGNGFNNIIEQKDFDNPSHVGTWGVSDEDLFVKANNEFKKLYEKKQKFASLVFTLSSHAPFDIPKGKVKEYVGDEPHLKTAIKYADYALGKFFELAKKEEYFKDTIFVVLADHNLRFSADDMVPVKEFQIPALIIADGIKPMKCKKITTQPDILATALDMTGLDLEYPILGNSIFNPNKKDFALLQFHKNYAFLQDDKVAILRPEKSIVNFKYQNHKLTKADTNYDDINKEAISLINVIDNMYQNRLYN